MEKSHKIALMFLTALSVLIADQLSKILAIDVLGGEKIYTLTPFLNFTLVKNFGISFGTFNNPTQGQIIFILLSLAIIITLFIWMLRSESENLCFPIGLVIGGAVGNIIDRLVHGAVIDFIDVVIFGWHYPTFNLADAAICVGVFIMLIWPQPVKPKGSA